ncbi:MAG: hypothetical protein AAF583_01000 [Pseudomonadota bacterium]
MTTALHGTKRVRRSKRRNSSLRGWMIGFVALAYSSIFMNAGWACIGYGLIGTATFQLLVAQDRPFMIRWIIIFMAVTQNVLAPHWYYLGAYAHYKYGMYVDIETYMPIAASSMIALTAGLLCFGNRTEAKLQQIAFHRIPDILRVAPLFPFALLGLSISGSLVASVYPGIGFIGILLANLKYPAALLLLLSRRPDRYVWLTTIMLISLLEALATSLFHDISLWGILISGLFVHVHRTSVSLKTLGLGVLISFVLILQSVKNDYRQVVWAGDADQNSAIYIDLASDRLVDLLNGRIPIDEIWGQMVMRLNQGWVVSAVIDTVPEREPYANGETISDAVYASFVPRILAPDKTISGGRENFLRFTGLELHRSASIAIGLIGEAYANFGPWGGPVLLFLYGVSVTLAMRMILIIGNRFPVLVIFLPNIFLHAIKTETEFVTVLNFMSKSGIFHLVLGLVLFELLRQKHVETRFQRSPLITK